MPSHSGLAHSSPMNAHCVIIFFMFESDKKSSLERLKKGLYSRSSIQTDTNSRHDVHERQSSVPEQWKIEDTAQSAATLPEKQKMPLHKVVLLSSLGFFSISILVAAYAFFGGSTSISVDNIGILIEGPVSIAGGDNLSLNTSVVNKNSSNIELVDLIVEFPQGTKDPLNLSQDLVRSRISLGSIKAGGVVQQKIDSIIFGKLNEKKSVKFTVEYRTSGSNAIFFKEKSYEVQISSSPLIVNIENSPQVNSGQKTDIKIVVASNSNTPVKNLLLNVDYPFGFTFDSSDPAPLYSNNIFKVGDLAPGAKKTFVIKGSIQGQDGEKRFVKANVGIASKDDEKIIATTVISTDNSFNIIKPFIGIDLTLDGTQAGDYISKPGAVIRAEVTWTNNLTTSISDGSISVGLAGIILDKNSVYPEGGFYNSLTNTITWDSRSLSDLLQIAPGESGRVSFRFSPQRMLGGSYPTNPQIDVTANIKGNSIDQGKLAQDLVSTLSRKVLVSSEVALSPQVFYLSNLISNSGPIPPKAEQKTTYTLVWTINNSSNSISHTQVRATLPPYVTFTNLVSPDGDVTYNPVGNEVVWNAGSVARAAGFIGQAKTVSFQVSVVPSVTQVGQSIELMSASTLTATDDFTGSAITSSGRSITTRLDDNGANSNSGTVIP